MPSKSATDDQISELLENAVARAGVEQVEQIIQETEPMLRAISGLLSEGHTEQEVYVFFAALFRSMRND